MSAIKELVKKSRSYRGYDRSRKITREELLEFIDCARFCPSSVNMQPLKFAPVCEPGMVDKVQSVTGWAKGLPGVTLPHKGKEPVAFIVICLDTSIDDKTPRYLRDAAACAQTMLLAAVEKDLGGCMIGSFDAGKVKEYLSLPDHVAPMLVVAFGKPDEKVKIVEIDPGDSVTYYRDDEDTHYVPKRKLKDIII